MKVTSLDNGPHMVSPDAYGGGAGLQYEDSALNSAGRAKLATRQSVNYRRTAPPSVKVWLARGSRRPLLVCTRRRWVGVDAHRPAAVSARVPAGISRVECRSSRWPPSFHRAAPERDARRRGKAGQAR